MILKIRISEVGPIQKGTRKDGSGEWFARNVKAYDNAPDSAATWTDYVLLRVTGDLAQQLDTMDLRQTYEADITCSVREWNGKWFQEMWAKSLTVVDNNFINNQN